MKMKSAQWFVVVLALLSVVFLGACAKKKVATVTPPPPPPARPTATLAISRADIQKGESTVLSWSTENANSVTISSLGTVPASGIKAVTPTGSSTYNLLAKGPGGEAEASARVTVTSPPPVASVPIVSMQDLFAQQVKDVYFDYDKYTLRNADQANVASAAKFLKSHPETKILVEGHCDERGSEEYNLALGDNRADATRDYLTAQGVSNARIKTISYGKEKPFCTGDDERCWQQNRRAHFVLEQDSVAQAGH